MKEKVVIVNLEPLTRVAGLPDDLYGLTSAFFYYYELSYLGAIEMPFSGRATLHSVIPFTDEEISIMLSIADNKIESKSLEDMLSKIYDVVIKRAEQLEKEDPDMKGFSEGIRLLYFTDGYDAVIYIARAR
jgi:hypothetical protein